MMYNGSISHAKQWIIDNSCFWKTGDTGQYTHLLLDGGKCAIPPAKLHKFHIAYAASVFMDERNYICECRTKIFKFFIDIDFEDINEIMYETMRQYIMDIQTVLKEFFEHVNNTDLTDDDFTVYVATTVTKKVTKNGKDFIKTACHPIWPNICVDQQTALIIRKALTQFFVTKYGERHLDNTWDDVFDKCVYTSNGLRMIGSYKVSFCKKCRGNRNDDYCAICHNMGKIHENRRYLVTDIIDYDGVTQTGLLKEYEENMVALIEKTSIVTNHNYMPFSLIPVYPEWFNIKAFEFDNVIKSKTVSLKQYPFGETRTKDDELGSGELKLKKQLEPDSTLFKKIERFIKTTMPEIYKNIVILDINICDNDTYYVARTNSSFCMNVSRHHNSSTIYFLINRFGIYQKCFCRKDSTEGRQFGKCSRYASQRRPLSTEIKKLLFPSYKNGNSIVCELPAMKQKIEKEITNEQTTKEIEQIDNFVYYLIDIIADKGGYEDNTFNSKKMTKKKQMKPILY